MALFLRNSEGCDYNFHGKGTASIPQFITFVSFKCSFFSHSIFKTKGNVEHLFINNWLQINHTLTLYRDNIYTGVEIFILISSDVDVKIILFNQIIWFYKNGD